MHAVALSDFILHLGFESCATCGGYYARGFCKHTWHRITVAVVWSLVTTYALVALVG